MPNVLKGLLALAAIGIIVIAAIELKQNSAVEEPTLS